MSGLHYVGLLLSSFITESTLSSKSPVLCEEFHWLIEDCLYAWGCVGLVLFKKITQTCQAPCWQVISTELQEPSTIPQSNPTQNPSLKESRLQSARLGLRVPQSFIYTAATTTTPHRSRHFTSQHCYISLSAIMRRCVMKTCQAQNKTCQRWRVLIKSVLP